jgi:hypothetical protein
MNVTYPAIKGPVVEYLGRPCIAFHKYDGSNLRFLWQAAKGWFRFGTRQQWLKKKSPTFGIAMGLFQETIAPGLLAVLTAHEEYRKVRNLVAFCEFFGPSSFAGLHQEDEPKELRLFDVWLPGRGLVPPQELVRNFGHLPTAEAVYEGLFDREFIEGVKAGSYPVREGVVAKGTVTRGDKVELWSAKVKTTAWLAELARRSSGSAELRRQFDENVSEQTG